MTPFYTLNGLTFLLSDVASISEPALHPGSVFSSESLLGDARIIRINFNNGAEAQTLFFPSESLAVLAYSEFLKAWKEFLTEQSK